MFKSYVTGRFRGRNLTLLFLPSFYVQGNNIALVYLLYKDYKGAYKYPFKDSFLDCSNLMEAILRPYKSRKINV